MNDPGLLTVKQVAERLGVRRETVRNWIKRGQIKAAMLGGAKLGYRIRESEIDRLLINDYPQEMPEVVPLAGVYRVANLRTGETYIGSSINVQARLADHRRCLNAGNHCNRRLQEDWMTYGEEAFVMGVVEQTPLDNASLASAEMRYLEAAHRSGRSYNRPGQNVQSGRHERAVKVIAARCSHADPRGRCTASVTMPGAAFCDKHLARRQ